jgi:hypothetical protein
MTEEEKLKWGRCEVDARMTDIAAVKTGVITLEAAQKAARSRARSSGLTRAQASRAVAAATREARLR